MTNPQAVLTLLSVCIFVFDTDFFAVYYFYYSCPRCANNYTHQASLARHLKWECGVEAKFTCSVCRFKSKRKSNYIRHMVNIHKVSRSEIVLE
jgi:uncharacterized C2H2 Zn-finger protein